MSPDDPTNSSPIIGVELLDSLGTADLNDLCDAAEAAIRDGGGFGWLVPPPRDILEAYWRGVTLIPERDLLVGRLDGVIAGSCQVLKPARNNEAQSFACNLNTNFVAPWGRGYGLSAKLIETAEAHARNAGFEVLNLDVRQSQTAAIRLFERLGYTRFGAHPRYARDSDGDVTGYFYYKALRDDAPDQGAGS
jgi:ribosomal protein S18 acetylase RimI-like enzyme